MPFIWHALPPEFNVGNLLSGPGVGEILAAAESYLDTAVALKNAASETEAAMGDMGNTWGGMSADKAQAAFRNHTNWLHEQSIVAQDVSAVLHGVAAEFSGAQSVMDVVGGLLAENRSEFAFLVLTSPISNNGPALIINHLEYLVIWGLAAGVMDAYEGAVVPTLAKLPPPTPPMPIVADPGLPPTPPKFDVPVYDTKSGPIQKFDGSTTHPDSTTNNNTNTNTNTGNNNTGDTNTGNTDTNTPTDTTQSPSQTQPATTDPSDITSPLSDSGMNGGTDGTSAEQPGFYGTSPNSPTLAGLNGGAGSLVALSMARGGLGSMPGASTGFRMPSNWLRGPGTAFGASSNPGAAGPATRGTPRRGAIAPKAQMRRRRDEERKPGKVFVPGEELEVPVLEKPPVIGVIEYADERPDDAVPEGELLVGVLERSDDEVAVAESEPAR